MSYFTDLITPVPLASVRATIKSIALGVGIDIDAWPVGDVGQQIFEAVAQTVFTFRNIVPMTIRGYASLDTSTDPGDPDAFDASNAARTPIPGPLSNYGQSTYFTTRGDASFATGAVLFVNAGAQPRTFAPGSLTFTWTGGSPTSPPPTYRNAPDAATYTNADGTVTVPAGTSKSIPVVADVVGASSSAPPSTLSLTTTLLGCTATNPAAVLGTDREDADTYRERCREAASRLSLAGPKAIYQYLAAKNLDGTPLLNASGNPVNINRVFVTEDSTTGIANAYFASPSGVATNADVTAANLNISNFAFALPDAITFGPLTSLDTNGPGGKSATPVSVHVAGTVKVKNRPGLLASDVKAAIVATTSPMALAFAGVDTLTTTGFDIGGRDQVAGAGVIYTDDLEVLVGSSFPGLYNVVITTPGSATTALAQGQVATMNSVTTDWAVVIVP